MDYSFEFDLEKSIETILYIVQNVAEPGFHRISKVLYFADKQHLEHYGRFICGDTYVAMKNGPVPSNIYDLFKIIRGDGKVCKNSNEIEKAQSSFKILGQYSVENLREPNLLVFSESDLECLNSALAEYGRLSFNKLTDLSHDAAWSAADRNNIIQIEDIAAIFDDGDLLIKHLSNQYPD